MSNKVSYSNFFAPPEFLQMRSVSVEILSRGIYFLTVKKNHKGLLPDKFGFIPLSPGDVVSGEALNKDVVIKALISIRKKTGLDFVRFSIPEEQTYIFKTHLPNLKSEEIREVLDFKLEENVPLASKEAVFDYEIVKQNNTKNSGLDVVVSAAPLKVVEEFQKVFMAAGLTPILFSPESNNVARAVIHEGNEQVLVTIRFKDANIVMSLVIGGLVYQTSSINLGGSIFIDLLSKYYKIPPTELTKAQKDKLYVESEDSLETFSQVASAASTIKDEIEKFISYANERQDVVTKIDRVILCGEEAMIVGLAKYLNVNLGLPVDIAGIWVNNFNLNNYLPELSQRESLNYAVVNGLSLL